MYLTGSQFLSRVLTRINIVQRCSYTRLAEVGKLEIQKLEGNYDVGQLFLHRIFGYRGVILFPWVARVYDRDLAGNKDREKSSSIDSNEATAFSHIGREVKSRTHNYYQVLIDSRDCPYIRAQTEAVTFLGNQENSRSLYAIPGLDYVAHEDIIPYVPTEKNALNHELFDKFLQISQERDEQDITLVPRDTLKAWQEKNHPWLELSDVHKETTENIRVTVIPFYMGCRESQNNSVYWWRYCIRIENLGNVNTQLRERHWRIFSLSGTLETVRGRGVVGQEPILTKLSPAFQYSSHVSLQAPSGHMWGTFKMEREDGSFDCRIPPFSLESKHENTKDKLKRNEVEALVKSRIEKIDDPAQTYNWEYETDSIVLSNIDSLRVYEEDNYENQDKDKPSLHEQNGQCDLIKKYPPSSRLNFHSSSNGEVSNTSDTRYKFDFYTFGLNEDGEEADYMDDENDDGQSPASHQWILPSKSLDGLWDSLVFESNVKHRLMQYLRTALLFSEKGVNSSLITWNKVILLHGPPGTGKTSLCRALAQKSTIRLSNRFRYGQLVEINSHSLFSKWFSESGKLIMKMFEKIQEMIEDPETLIFLIIDEVESLAQCRISAGAGSEPTDSIRAVNALLTQIDRIKRYPNVIILTTSNVAGTIDLAFVDRADLKIYIGSPPPEIIYQIYSSSIKELGRVGIISSALSELSLDNKSAEFEPLMRLSRMSYSMSGRTLRRIPFLTFSNFIHNKSCTLGNFLSAMEQTIQTEISEALLVITKPSST